MAALPNLAAQPSGVEQMSSSRSVKVGAVLQKKLGVIQVAFASKLM